MRNRTLWVLFGFFAFAGAAWAHVGHGHAAPAPAPVPWGLKGLEEVMNVHPLFVHFPIALLLESSALYLLGVLFRKAELLTAGKWTLYFGTLAAVVTVWTGLAAARNVSHDEAAHAIMVLHQYLGFAVLSISLLLSAWVFFSKASIPSRRRPVFLLCLLVLDGILVQGADFGGRMVFLHGVGVGRKSAVEQAPVHLMDEGAHEHGASHHHGGAHP